ncbi:MAG: hypothetical protein HYY06_33420 [Deltaproteobacteria bacterium]|nr:hypothetical protein [Deltaproteobacteria bacterium]
MRTTIELTRTQRARLVRLAAERGEKGFSRIIQAAIDRYLSEESDRLERAAKGRATLGTLSEEDAEHYRDVMRATRDDRRWR